MDGAWKRSWEGAQPRSWDGASPSPRQATNTRQRKQQGQDLPIKNVYSLKIQHSSAGTQLFRTFFNGFLSAPTVASAQCWEQGQQQPTWEQPGPEGRALSPTPGCHLGSPSAGEISPGRNLSPSGKALVGKAGRGEAAGPWGAPALTHFHSTSQCLAPGLVAPGEFWGFG